MDMGFAPTWLSQVSPLLHKTTLTTAYLYMVEVKENASFIVILRERSYSFIQ